MWHKNNFTVRKAFYVSRKFCDVTQLCDSDYRGRHVLRISLRNITQCPEGLTVMCARLTNCYTCIDVHVCRHMT